MFLSKEEICILTGRKTRSSQKRVLTKNGIPFTEDGDGNPIVLESALTHRTIRKVTIHPPIPVNDKAAKIFNAVK